MRKTIYLVLIFITSSTTLLFFNNCNRTQMSAIEVPASVEASSNTDENNTNTDDNGTNNGSNTGNNLPSGNSNPVNGDNSAGSGDPTSGTNPTNPASSDPTSGTNPTNPASGDPTSGTNPTNPASSDPTSGTNPSNPASSDPTSGTNPSNPASSDPTSGTNPSNPASSDPTSGTPIVNESCASMNKQKISVSFFFPKPNYTCEWDKNGNLETRNDYLQARIEQMQELVLAPNSLICDIKFNFAQQQFLYDDHFLFTFNNAVIASSFDFSNKLTSQNNILRYDWSKIAGMFWDKSKEGTYCPANSSCSWPDTDVAGNINMTYPSSLFQQLMGEDINRTTHALKFISIGDNDSNDCEHSDIRFSIDVEFVTKP